MPRLYQKTTDKCPVCDSENITGFFTLPDMPVNVCVQWPSQRKATRCSKGDIDLVFCHNCGFIWNRAFDQSVLDYSVSYENSLFFSPLYKKYTEQLVNRLVNSYDLHEKFIIDIGCGKGDFLFMLCRAGNNHGLGFDSSFDQRSKIPEQVKIIRDFYSEKYSNYKADLITSRYVFEHIKKPHN